MVADGSWKDKFGKRMEIGSSVEENHTQEMFY